MSSLRPSTAAGHLGRLTGIIGVAVLAGVLAAGLTLPFIGGLGLTLKSAADNFESLPGDLAQPPLPQRNVMTYADGTPMATFYETTATLGNVGNRVVVPISAISPSMQQSIVAIEDHSFFQEGALDLRGTMRALLTNVGSNSTAEGGSTLTQEYVKNLLQLEGGDNAAAVAAASQKSVSRKIRELKYAVDLAKTDTKQQILEKYLNLVYFGNGAFGVEAAAERYFSTSAANLTLPQAAMLAGIVQSPGAYDPINGGGQGVSDTMNRRNAVLQAMVTNQNITQQQADQAKAAPLNLQTSYPSNGCAYAGSAAFFCDYALRTVMNNPTYGKTPQDRQNLWNQGGLTVTTTLDRNAQNNAQTAEAAHVYAGDPVAGAVDMVQPGTGKILAMTQSIPYGSGAKQTTMNLSVDADMGGGNGFQTGSTFKAFYATAALQQGIDPYTENINSPYSITLPENSFRTCSGGPAGNKPYPVTNDATSLNGNFNMQTALAMSVNTYFVQLEQQIGICPGIQVAAALGVHQANGSQLQQVASATLGTNLVAPLTMAEAYATFAARGVHCNPIALTSVVNAATKQSYGVPSAGCSQVLQPPIADTMNSLLQTVMQPGGTGAALDLADGRTTAGKTGTTNKEYDVWFIGYTPQITAASWIGGVNGNVSMNNITIGGKYYPTVFGGTGPGPIWKQAMDGATSGQAQQPFVAPPPYATATPTPPPPANPPPAANPAPTNPPPGFPAGIVPPPGIGGRKGGGGHG